jgi:protein phosphatase
MGTTVSGLVRVGDQLALAHIGDSRIYRWRDGTLTQITKDHTFVQRLVDSGRITAEEAAVHPRRSVLMRVLGDVDLTPEIDVEVLDTQAGDRWLLCSDGLSGYVSEQRLGELLGEHADANAAIDALIDESLDNGAPDNVTAVIVGVDASASSSVGSPLMVGSAAQPLSYAASTSKRSVRLPSLLLHPLTAVTAPADEHFEPESEEFLLALIAEDERRKVRRRITWLVGVVLIASLIVGVFVAGYQWTQTRYFVGVSNGQVAIFQGVQQNIGPFPLSTVYFESDIDIDDLSPFSRERVESTINASDLPEALSIIDRLQNELD